MKIGISHFPIPWRVVHGIIFPIAFIFLLFLCLFAGYWTSLPLLWFYYIISYDIILLIYITLFYHFISPYYFIFSLLYLPFWYSIIFIFTFKIVDGLVSHLLLCLISSCCVYYHYYYITFPARYFEPKVKGKDQHFYFFPREVDMKALFFFSYINTSFKFYFSNFYNIYLIVVST